MRFCIRARGAFPFFRFLPRICYCFQFAFLDLRERKDLTRVIVGVPKESYPGERRVALVPAVIPNLAKAGLEVIVETGAGEQAGYPDAMYVDKGAKIVADRAAVFATADIVVQVLCYGSNDVTGKADLATDAARAGADWVSAAIGFSRSCAADRAGRRDRFLRGTDAANYPRPEHGRPLLDGNLLRLQGRVAGGRNLAANFSHDDDRCGDDHAGACVRDWRGCGRVASDLDRPPFGRSRLGL